MILKGQRVVATSDMRNHYKKGDKATVVGGTDKGMVHVVFDKSPDVVSTVLFESVEKDKEAEYVQRALKIANEEEVEEAHAKLDDLLCEVLKKEGYTELVEVFDKADKWYA